jgi:hypothetical protein
MTESVTDAQAEQDLYAEAAAKKMWQELTPDPGTIAWYEKVSVEAENDSTPATNPSHYRDLLAEFRNYEAERHAFDDDEAWLVQLTDEFGDLNTEACEICGNTPCTCDWHKTTTITDLDLDNQA